MIEAEAADWLVRRNAGIAPAGAMQRWLSADARHAQAFAELESAWRTLNQPRESGLAGALAQALNARAQRRARRRNAIVAAGMGLAAAAAIIFGFFAPGSRAPTAAAPLTVLVRPDRQVLPDGSVVELNAGAEIAVNFTPEKRGVRLLRGEALFAVAKDATHPFVVTAGGVDVRAVGTAFSVRQGATRIDVLVTEGCVAVQRTGVSANAKPVVGAAQPVYLQAGNRLAIPADPSADGFLAVMPVTPGQIATALAWRGHRVEFTGTTLADAIELFNRDTRVKLAIADPAVAQLQISGIFWSDDPDGFVRLLESGMNVRAERSPDAIVLRRQ